MKIASDLREMSHGIDGAFDLLSLLIIGHSTENRSSECSAKRERLPAIYCLISLATES